MQKSASFEYSVYVQEGSRNLARAWASRAGYFYGIWLSQPLHKYVFTDEDVDGWDLPESASSAMAKLSRAPLNRVSQLFSKAPRM